MSKQICSSIPNYSYSDFQIIGLTQSVSVRLPRMSPDPLGSGDKIMISKNQKKETIAKFSGIVKNQIYKSQKNRSNNYFLCYSNKMNIVYKNSFLCELKYFYSRLNSQANSSVGDSKIKPDKKSFSLNSIKSNDLGLCTPYESPARRVHGGGKGESKTYTLYFVVFFLLIKRKNQKLSKGNVKDLVYCLKLQKNLFYFLEPNFETDFSSTNIGFRSGRSLFSAIQTFSESLALGESVEKNSFFQQTRLSPFVPPLGDAKYTMPNGSPPRRVPWALNEPKKEIKSLSNISLRKRILFLAQTERLNLKTLFYLQKYSNALSSSIFCPNQIKSVLTLKQTNLSSALNQIGSFTLPNRNVQGGSFMYGAFQKVVKKKRKSGIKKNKSYPYFYFVKEKKITFTTFRMSRSVIFFLFLFFFLRLIYPLLSKFPPHQGLYPLNITPHFKRYLEIIKTKRDESLLTPSASVLAEAKEMTFSSFTKHRLFFDPLFPDPLGSGDLSFSVPLTLKDFCIVRKGLHFYNNLNSQNLSEQTLQYKLTSSFLLPQLMKNWGPCTHFFPLNKVWAEKRRIPSQGLRFQEQAPGTVVFEGIRRLDANNVLHLSPEGSGDLSVSGTLTLKKNQKVKMLPKILGNEFFSLNANFLEFLYSIIHLKQSFYFSISLTKKDFYSYPNSKFRILFPSNRLAPKQKKDLFIFNNNYQYLFGLLTRGYYQLSALTPAAFRLLGHKCQSSTDTFNFLETCIFLISNNSFLLKSQYFLVKTLLFSKCLPNRERNYYFDPLEGAKLESPYGRHKVDQIIATKIEKKTGTASIFLDFSSFFVPTTPSLSSFRVEKAQVHYNECTLKSRFSNLGPAPYFLKKIKPMLTSNILTQLTCYPFNLLLLVKRLGTEFSPPLAGIRKDVKIKLPTLNVPVGNWHLYIPEGDVNNVSTSQNFWNFRGFSILNLFYKEVTSILSKSETKLTLVLEDLLKYQFSFNVLKHQHYKIVQVPAEQLHYKLPPRRKLIMQNQEALSSYRSQHITLFSLSKKMKSFVDFPLYLNRKLLKKMYFKKSKIFLNISTQYKTRLVEQGYKLKVHLLIFIPYRGFSSYLTFLPLSGSGTMALQPIPLWREQNRNNNYYSFGRTIIMPSKLSTKEYFQLLKTWFLKKERNFKTLMKESSLFIRSWCVYYRIVSKCLQKKALMPPQALKSLGREKCGPCTNLCLPNQSQGSALTYAPRPQGSGGKRLGRETRVTMNEKALNVKMSSGLPLRTTIGVFKEGRVLNKTFFVSANPIKTNSRAYILTDLTKYYDFLITKLLWKKVFSLIGKKSIRFLGNQRYLNSSNNLTKILYKFFIFIKKEQLWVFIQSLPPSAGKNSFLSKCGRCPHLSPHIISIGKANRNNSHPPFGGDKTQRGEVPMVQANEKKFTNFRLKQLYISLPRHSDLVLMNHYVLSFYKSPYNYTETSYWLKLVRE
jgi:hypothetical protein